MLLSRLSRFFRKFPQLAVIKFIGGLLHLKILNPTTYSWKMQIVEQLIFLIKITGLYG